MTIRYTIERWHSPFRDRAAAFHTCNRADKARKLLWAEIYAMLQSESLLDRPIAKLLESQFDNCDTSKPRFGYYRREQFKVRDFPCAFVQFTAERI